MPPKPSPPLPITARQKRLLTTFISRRNAPQHLVKRATIIVRAGEGKSNYSTAKKVGLTAKMVKIWRTRWLAEYEQLCSYEQGSLQAEVSDKDVLERLLAALCDQARSGCPTRITEAQKQQIIALACRKPSEFDIPISIWTHKTLAQVAVRLGIVERISSSYLGKLLKKTPTPTA